MNDNDFLLKTSFYGYQLISCDSLVDFVQARKHKKKRINKKWLKRYGMRSIPKRELYITSFDRRIYGHPKYIDMLIAEARKNNGVVKDVSFYGQL